MKLNFEEFCSIMGYELSEYQKKLASDILSGDRMAISLGRKIGMSHLRRCLHEFKAIKEDQQNG